MTKSALLLIVAVRAVAIFAPSAPAHRYGCHRAHSCPSDHATYRWRGRLCKPTSDKRDNSFRTRVRYRGFTYYCKR